MKSTFSLPSAVVALLLVGDASAYHLGGSDPRAIRNNRRQEESASPEFSTLPDDTLPSATTPPNISFPTSTDTLSPSLTFVPSSVSGLPSGAPPFPTGIFNSTAGFPGPFPTATGSPGFPGNPNGPVPSSIVDGPTSSVDCSALASSIFGSIFPYPTGGPISWPGLFPSGGGGPIPSIIFDPFPSESVSDVPFPMPTITGPDTEGPISTPTGGPILPDEPISSFTSTQSEVEPTSTFATLTIANKRHAGGRHGHSGPIPSGVFPPGQGPAFPTGVFPTPTEEQIAQISHFFEVCGNGENHWWFPLPGKGYNHGKGKGKGKGCDKDGDE